jgi:hypothetical protein
VRLELNLDLGLAGGASVRLLRECNSISTIAALTEIYPPLQVLPQLLVDGSKVETSRLIESVD